MGQPNRRAYSLSFRLLSAASVAVVLFLGLTGITLDRAFRDSAEAAVRDRLQGQIYALLASADLDDYDQVVMPDVLADERYLSPASGIYAALAEDRVQWRSPSALGLEIPWLNGLEPSEQQFSGPLETDIGDIFLMGFGVAWELPGGRQRTYTFSAAENADGFYAQIAQFRQSLWGWLAGAAVVLLVAQVLVLRWGLSPLRRVAEEIQAVETGEQDKLSGDYPRELAGLTKSLNALIGSERRSLERYRNSLGDLAHSLKTPLTVMRSSAESLDQSDTKDEVLEQARRMNELVAYQLRRAAAAGSRTLGRPIPVEETADQITSALSKVHQSRGIDFQLLLSPGVVFRGERGDLMELLGNLLDNAGKWANSKVRLTAESINRAGARIPGLRLLVEDDGPGIEPAKRETLLKRGVRGDERVDGHGIGLAIVSDLVAAHGGTLSIDESRWGGAAIEVELPPLE